MDIDPWVAAQAKIGFASFCGAMVRLFFRPASSLTKTAMLVFSCVTCGFYGTPVLMSLWALPDEYVGAVGAALGFVGLSFAEGVLKMSEKTNIMDFMPRWMPRPRQEDGE